MGTSEVAYRDNGRQGHDTKPEPSSGCSSNGAVKRILVLIGRNKRVFQVARQVRLQDRK